MQGRHRPTTHKPGNRVFLLFGWVIVSGLFCGLPQAFADHPLKIGIIDTQSVIENSNSGKKAIETLNEHAAVRRKLLEADRQEITKLEKQLQTESGRSETETQFLQEQLQEKIQGLQRRVQKFEQELNEKQNTVRAEYMKKISVATKAVAERSGFSIVIDKGNEFALKVVLYASEGMDITDDVLKEMNQLYK